MNGLKRIYVAGFGPYICGRKKSEAPNSFPWFNPLSAAPKAFNDIDTVRKAAETARPIYAAIENIDYNDQFGDCTSCAALKMQAILDCLSGRTARRPHPQDALWLYSQTTNPPFDPKTGDNDNGTDLQTVLKFWQTNGLYSDGTGTIKGAYAVDATKPDEVRAALDQYGLLYAGCDLPKAWEDIKGTSFTWGMAGPPDPNAGHCTFTYGYNDVGVFEGTWGMEGTIPWDALAYYFGAAQGGELFAVAAA